MSWQVGELVAPDGTSLRVGQWTAPAPVGHCLLLQGRGDFLEKHEDTARRLAGLGLHVVSLDWRGQGRSGRLGAVPGVSDVVSFDDYLADLDLLLSTLPGLPGPRSVLAHSMGALVAALHLVRHPGNVSRAVLVSPMWAFSGPLPLPVVGAVAGVAVALGRGTALAAGEKAATPGRCELATNMATGDAAGLERLRALQLAHPDAVVAGSTWRWVRAAARAMRELERADLSGVATDVLVASAPADPTVDPAAHHRITARLPRGRVVEYTGRHDLLFESDDTTARLWQDIAAHLPGPAGVAS